MGYDHCSNDPLDLIPYGNNTKPSMTYRYNKTQVPTYQRFCEIVVGDLFPNDTILEIDGDSDPYRRIYTTTDKGKFMIRTWDIKETKRKIIVELTCEIDK